MALIALLVLLAMGAERARAAFPGGNGRIAFTVSRSAIVTTPPHPFEQLVSSRIETVLPSGRGRRVLRACPAGERCLNSEPAWSPSGRLLAFGQQLSTGRRLAIVRADGTGLRRLPALTDVDWGSPAWSPDGRRLAFVGDWEDRLYTVRSNGSRLRRITSEWAAEPSWSLTGTIAFRTDDGIYTMRPDGSQGRRLIHSRYWPPSFPDWSPHASKLAYTGGESFEASDIYIRAASGRVVRRLTWRGGTQPAWSPDGRYIAFVRNNDLYVMRANGRGLRRVVDGPPVDGLTFLGAPSWQPLPR